MTDVPADTTTTASIAVGSTYTGTIDTGGDHDWIAVNLVAGQKYTFTLDGHGSNALEDPYLYLRDSSGTVLVENDDGDGNRNSRIVFTATTTGTYYLDASAWDDDAHSFQYTGDYILSAQHFAAPPVYTYSQIADQLVNGYWGGDWHHFNVTQGGTITVNVTGLTTAGQTLARAALKEWSDVIGITFKEVSGTNADGTPVGQIVFDDNQDGAFTNTSWSKHIISESDVNVSTQWLTDYGTSLDSYSFQSYVHEIGHALGLGHGGNYNDTATYPDDAIYANDAWSTTVMSYFSQHDSTYFEAQGFSEDFALTPMSADILAMQTLYGLSTTTRTGNTTYGYGNTTGNLVFDTATNPHAAYTIVDSGGIDTLNYSRTTANEVINLNPLTFSNVAGDVGNVSIAVGTVIENATSGSGSDILTGNSANNTLTAGGGNDVLYGNAGDDTLTGGAGADNLTGGIGADSFKDTAAGLNGDTITDFSKGDKIVISDAALAGFSFSISGHTLNFNGGSLTLTDVPSGEYSAQAAPGGGVQIVVDHDTARNDFNGDGRSDILWRNDNGTLTDWLGTANGGFTDNYANAGTTAAPTDWHVVGTGDFNGDGHDDILWRNTNGALTDWVGNPNGSFTDNSATAGTAAADNSWQVVATGDFNGDNRDDILWRNTGGTLNEWLGNTDGSFTDNYGNAGTSAAPTDWHVVGTGDFNGDGFDDILWRNTGGTLSDWLGSSDGSFTDNYANAGTTAVPNDWTVVGTGDFNGDGRSDILWRNTNGTVTDWLGTSTGGFTDNYANAGSTAAPNAWHVVSVGDFNGDHRDDILWRNDNGTITDWLGTSNGGFTDNYAHAGTTAAPIDWHVQDTLF